MLLSRDVVIAGPSDLVPWGGCCIRGQQLLVERLVVNGTTRHVTGGPGQETFERGRRPPGPISFSLSLSNVTLVCPFICSFTGDALRFFLFVFRGEDANGSHCSAC